MQAQLVAIVFDLGTLIRYSDGGKNIVNSGRRELEASRANLRN
jgi:hypothetical protein